MHVTITRESVGPADDLMAPHEKKLRNIEKRTLANIIEEVRNDYLPRNVVGGSTWVIEVKSKPLAIVAFPSGEIVFVNKKIHTGDLLEVGVFLRAKCVGTFSPDDWIENNAATTEI